MTTKLTIKQEAFCQAYIETGNASEAYRRAYGAGNQKPETLNRNAFKLLNENSKIEARIAALRKKIEKRHDLTIDDLIAELEDARQVALRAQTPQAGAAIAGTMGKAKLLGHDKTIIAGDPDKPILTSIAISFVKP
jgi:phage terminase small subunit